MSGLRDPETFSVIYGLTCIPSLPVVVIPVLDPVPTYLVKLFGCPQDRVIHLPWRPTPPALVRPCPPEAENLLNHRLHIQTKRQVAPRPPGGPALKTGVQLANQLLSLDSSCSMHPEPWCAPPSSPRPFEAFPLVAEIRVLDVRNSWDTLPDKFPCARASSRAGLGRSLTNHRHHASRSPSGNGPVSKRGHLENPVPLLKLRPAPPRSNACRQTMVQPVKARRARVDS